MFKLVGVRLKIFGVGLTEGDKMLILNFLEIMLFVEGAVEGAVSSVEVVTNKKIGFKKL